MWVIRLKNNFYQGTVMFSVTNVAIIYPFSIKFVKKVFRL